MPTSPSPPRASAGPAAARRPIAREVGLPTGTGLTKILADSLRTSSTPHQTFPQVRVVVADGLACKPGSVPGSSRSPGGDHPSRAPLPTASCDLPADSGGPPSTYAQSGPGPPLDLAPGGVYLAARSPGRWWSLTPPFHPYRSARTRPAVCFLWHCPAGHPGWALPTTLPCGARTFLDAVPEYRRGRPVSPSAMPA